MEMVDALTSRIFVTGHPPLPTQGLAHTLESYGDEKRGVQVVINVSDKPCWENARWYQEQGIAYYWFPMGDCSPMGLQSIYAALVVLYQAEQQGYQVLLHCAAGVSRSQTVMDCYYYLRTGKDRKQPFSLIETIRVNWGKGTEEIHWNSVLERSCANPINGLPSLPEMKSWLENLRGQFVSETGIEDGSLTAAHISIYPY